MCVLSCCCICCCCCCVDLYGVPVVAQVTSATPLLSVSSPSHGATTAITPTSENSRAVRTTLTGGIAEDYVVLIKPLRANAPRVWVETYADPAGAASGALAAQPPSLGVMLAMYPDLAVLPFKQQSKAEYILIVDRSGSMGGQKMRDAITTLQMVLRGLPVGSLFQIVSFGSSYNLMFPSGSVEYNDDTLATASAQVDAMDANMGGTEIFAPLQTLFRANVNANKPRQVFLFTDGEVGNTRAVVDLCRTEHQRTGTRVFTFGIGRDVSHALCTGIASAGAQQCVCVCGWLVVDLARKSTVVLWCAVLMLCLFVPGCPCAQLVACRSSSNPVRTWRPR